MHCYLSPTWLANKRSIILSKSNVVLAANVLVHHICHLRQGDGLIPCLFGDQMQLYDMALITEESRQTQALLRVASTHAYVYVTIDVQARSKVSHVCK